MNVPSQLISRRALWSVLVLVPACSDDAVKSAVAPAPQRRERVEIALPPRRETPEEDVAHSRQSQLRIVSDVRDALTAPLEAGIDVDLPASTRDRFSSAIALVGWPAGKSVPSVRLNFVIDLDGAKLHLKSALSLGLEEALTGWAPFVVAAPAALEAVHARIRAQFIGDAPSDAQSLRMCLVESAPSAAADPKRPNVLVLSVDTLRADHLGCYGYARATSPRIDALVKDGVVFERAYSPAPWTLPAYGSLFTGLLPADHRAGIVTEREDAWGRDEDPPKWTTESLRRDVPTLAESFAAGGYRTAGFACNPYIGPAAGVARGFQQYTSYQYNSQNGVDLALEWLEEHDAERWFLFVHVIDPHMPYAPPSPFDTRFAHESIDELKGWPPNLDDLRKVGVDAATKQRCIDYYDGEIAFVDAQIGRLLDALKAKGALGDTLIVLHADHGEEFWEHGGCDHGHAQYEELLHVPLALVWPAKLPREKRVAVRVRATDVMPTLLELAGLKTPDGLFGKSLLPTIDGRESADRDAIAEAVHRGPREIKACWIGTDKLIASGAAANLCFDLARDPGELSDRASERAELVRKLRARLAAHHDRAKQSADPLKQDEGSRQRLNKLGYAGDDDAPSSKGSKDTPRKP